MLRLARLFSALAFLLVAAPLAAQPAQAPSIPSAETAFDNGLRSFQTNQFDQAARQFRAAANDYAYNQRTTAALLMAARADYAAGDAAAAASAATAFLREFPRSRYAADARALRRKAQARLDAIADVPTPTDLGVVLPLTDGDQPFTQALFNGVRLAVDEHNAADPARPIRLVFRSTGATADGAEDAVRDLAREDVEAAIGPLYSGEAIAAGAVADRERVALVAPLATDATVSEGRRYVLQANPTFEQRGRTMARYATADGEERAFGVVALEGTMGATMAAAFQAEVERRGSTVPFSIVLPEDGAWYRLPEILGDSLSLVEGLYLPVSGAGADEHAAGALRGLDQLVPEGARANLRLYGNTEWRQLNASRERASQYNTAFTSDFYLARGPATRDFSTRYEALAGVEPDRLAFAGYDVGRFVIGALFARDPETSAAEALRTARPFTGLGHRIYFGGGAVNEAMFILGYRDGELVVVE